MRLMQLREDFMLSTIGLEVHKVASRIHLLFKEIVVVVIVGGALVAS